MTRPDGGLLVHPVMRQAVVPCLLAVWIGQVIALQMVPAIKLRLSIALRKPLLTNGTSGRRTTVKNLYR